MLKITDAAREEIARLMEQEGRDDLALRVAILGRGPGGFTYDLQFVPAADRTERDEVLDTGSFEVLMDSDSAPNLDGATVDFVETLQQRGFQIDNPDSGWKDPLAAAVQKVLDERINPGVAMHGGSVTLLGVREKTAYISMGGGCKGCGLADVTLREGIVAQIRQAVPDIVDVVDTTDHTGGTNPYYQTAPADGSSPF